MKNEGIQSLRGLAALAVVLHHISVMVEKDKYFATDFLGGIFTNGFRGVDLFFVISGFIMMNTIHVDPDKTAAQFIVQRIKRIFVPYLPFFAILMAASLAVPAISGGAPFYFGTLISNIFLLPRSDLSTYVPVVAWTLTFELTFYLIFALAMLSGGNNFKYVLSAWMGLVFANLWIGIDYMVLDPLNFGFGIGVLSFHMAQGISDKFRLPIFICGVIVMVGLLSLPYEREQSLLVDIGFLIVSGVLCCSASAIGRNALAWVGDFSYSLYLVHYPIIAFLFIVLFRMGVASPLGTIPVAILSVAASMIGGYVYFRIFEVWLYRKLR